MDRSGFDCPNDSRTEKVLDVLPVFADDAHNPLPRVRLHPACIAVHSPCLECLVAIAIEPPRLSAGFHKATQEVEGRWVGPDAEFDNDLPVSHCLRYEIGGGYASLPRRSPRPI